MLQTGSTGTRKQSVFYNGCSAKDRILWYENTVNTLYYDWDESSKSSSPLPPFVPGVFNIKPYSAHTFSFKSEDATCSVNYCRSDGTYDESVWKGKLTGQEEIYASIPRGPASYPSSELSKVQLRAYAKLTGSALDTLAEMGEIRETISLLRHPFKKLGEWLESPLSVGSIHSTTGDLIKYYRNNPKLFARDVGRSGSAASNTWLELRYGVAPILYTIQDLLKLASTQLEKASSTIRSKRSRLKTSSVRTTNPTPPQCKVTVVTEDTMQVEGIVFYRRTKDQTQFEQLGIAPERIPETVWELTRLSFVVDWIFSVGDYISALTPPDGVTVLGSQRSYKWTSSSDVTLQVRSPLAPGNVDVYSNPAKGKVTQSKFVREVFSGGIPLPEFKGAKDLDYKKVLDLVALSYGEVIRRLR